MKKIYAFLVISFIGFGFVSPAQADSVCQKAVALDSQTDDDWNLDCLSTHRTNYSDISIPVAFNAKFYTFTLGREADIKITLNNDFDNRFFLMDGGSTTGTVLKELDGNKLETYLPAGTYTLETTSQYSQAYTLSLNYNDTGNTECVQAIILGTSISDGWIPSCESNNRDISDPYSPYPDLGHRAKFFTFSLMEDLDIRIDITSDKDSYIYLLSGTGEFATPLAEFSQAPVLTSLPAGDYTIELTTEQRYAPGDFTIQFDINDGSNVDQLDGTENNSGSGAFGLWFLLSLLGMRFIYRRT